MSTRCQIGFYQNKDTEVKKFEALIYRHSDGYPEGVLPEIVPFLKWWKSTRGISDLEYCSARLLQYLCNEYDGFKKELDKQYPLPQNLSGNGDYTGIYGHGICKQFHGDIEYFYYIYPNGIKVFSCGYSSKPSTWKIVFDINLDAEVNLDELLKQESNNG